MRDVEATEEVLRLLDHAATRAVADGRLMITIDDVLTAANVLATTPYAPAPWSRLSSDRDLGWRMAAAADRALASGSLTSPSGLRSLEVRHVLVELGAAEVIVAAVDARLAESILTDPPSETAARAKILSGTPTE